MNIIARQTFFNLVSIGFAFLIGAINTLYMYPNYMGSRYQGVIISLLAFSNLFQPFISFGLQHAIIKFFSSFKSKRDKDSLLIFSLLFPLIILCFFSLALWKVWPSIVSEISLKEPLIKTYAFVIIAIAISTSYFEIFFSWLRVNFATVFGNFLKEFYPRLLIFSLLSTYASGLIDLSTFIYAIVIGYYLRLFIIICYSFWIYTPRISFKFPPMIKEILWYSFLIFLSGAAASIILDIDKSMIASIITSNDVAFYSVALFIATVIESPGRAMFQIVSPLVAKAINTNDEIYLKNLLKKSSSNLLLISGCIFLLINLNLDDFYMFVNQPLYSVGIGIVGIISLGKLYSMSIGCLNNIISNSIYYPYVFWFSILSAIAAVVLNLMLIPDYGIAGAAYATLIVILIINTLKIALIKFRLDIHPFSKQTFIKIGVILAVYFIISQINLSFSPFINLLLRSTIITLVYAVLSYSLGLTNDINNQVKKILKR